jgi:hypothetical protein
MDASYLNDSILTSATNYIQLENPNSSTGYTAQQLYGTATNQHSTPLSYYSNLNSVNNGVSNGSMPYAGLYGTQFLTDLDQNSSYNSTYTHLTNVESDQIKNANYLGTTTLSSTVTTTATTDSSPLMTAAFYRTFNPSSYFSQTYNHHVVNQEPNDFATLTSYAANPCNSYTSFATIINSVANNPSTASAQQHLYHNQSIHTGSNPSLHGGRNSSVSTSTSTTASSSTQNIKEEGKY